MSHPNRRFTLLMTLAALTLLLTTHVVAQAQVEPRRLPAGQTVEREIAGVETHAYHLDLKADEFFQVRAEQKGADVTLRLLDAEGRVLASMDSPNGKQGPETLSFVAVRPGAFALEVSAPDPKAQKGAYTLRREEPRAATERDRRRAKAERLFVAGMAALGEKGRERDGVRLLSDAEAGWAELGDDYMRRMTAQHAIFHGANAELQEANKLLQEGQRLTAKSRADTPAARVKLAEALRLYRALNAKLAAKEMAERVRAMGEPTRPLLNGLEALHALSLQEEAITLDAMAQTHHNVGEHRQQVEHLGLALAAYQGAIRFIVASDNPYLDKKTHVRRIRSTQTSTLVNLASTLVANLRGNAEAVRHLNRALGQLRALYEEAPDPSLKLREAMAYQMMALAYLDETKGRRKGIEFLFKAVEILHAFPDRRVDVAWLLTHIATQYSVDFDYAEALKNLDAALSIYRELDNKAGQMDVLQLKAGMYYVLDNKPKVREFLEQALAILQSPDFTEGFKKRMGRQQAGFGVFDEFDSDLAEFVRLDRIGYSYQLLEEYGTAVEYYERALAAANPHNFNPGGVRNELRSIAYVYTKLGRWDKAYEYAARALEISRGRSITEEEAADLADVGKALSESGRPREALKYQNEALARYRLAGVDGMRGFSPLYSPLLNELARTHAALGNRRMAIFYGKQGVNAIQGERRRLLKTFDAEAQKGFLGKKEKYYRRLADWLIEEGRLPEAEQVLRMLKEEEYFGFVRRDESESEKLSRRAEPNAAEAAALKRYDEISADIAALGEQYAALEEKRKGMPEGRLSAPEKKRHEGLAQRLEEANRLLQVFLDRLAKEFAAKPRRANLKEENSSLRADLTRRHNELGDRGVVFLYTLVGEDRYRVILTTPNAQTDGKAEVKAADLRRKVAAFRRAVQDPRLDPRPLGKELYDIVVKPVEKQLVDARAETLLWSLDDTLRYLPLAALWDGEQYFGQKYRNVVVTLASRSRLDDKPTNDWRILGLGVSEARQVSFREADGTSYSISFPGLPGARRELRAIVRDEGSSEADIGVLPGRRLLDSAFTESALKESLGGRYKVVHIASHFAFRPGDLTKSFLLLGDGGALTLDEIKTSPRLAFTGVELLTLSACDTAVGESNADGVEVESFGVIAQDTGAKAVMATLWSVADESTPLLMSEFYRLRKENPEMNKAEALQFAQRAMIEGSLLSVGSGDGEARGAELAGEMRVGAGLPKLPFDQSRPYAHPYYWAPFVLIGNWR